MTLFWSLRTLVRVRYCHLRRFDARRHRQGERVRGGQRQWVLAHHPPVAPIDLDEERQEVAFHGCRAGDPADGLAARIACQPELQAGHQAAWPFQADARERRRRCQLRSEEHTSELQSLIRISYAVFCFKKKNI